MKKIWLGLFLACMLIFSAAAWAETDQAVTALFEQAKAAASNEMDRNTFRVFKPIEAKYNPTPGLPEGMVAKVEYRDDRLYVEIDTEQTDWATVIARGYTAGSGYVNVRPGFSTPEGYDGHISFGCALDEKESYIIELLRRDYAVMEGFHFNDRADNGEGIGRYDEETGIFQPIEMQDGNFVCVWYVNGRLEFRYLQTTITFTGTDAFKVELPGVPAENIALIRDDTVTDQTMAKIRKDVRDGLVMLEAADISGLEDVVLDVAVLVPEEAGNKEWTCQFLTPWGVEFPIEIQMPAEGMKYAPSRRYVLLYACSFDRMDSVREDEARLVWYDENGDLWGYQTLYFSQMTGEPKPWPYYVREWNPVPAGRFKGVKQDFFQGLDVEYDEEIGLLTYTVEPDELPVSADYERVFYSVEVEPPKAEYVLQGANQSGGNIVFGVDGAQHHRDEQLQRTRDHAADYKPGEKIYGMPLFMTYHQYSSDLTVYMTTEMTGPLAGGVVLISWWEEGQNPQTDDPAYVEYFAIRQEKCVRVLESAPYEDESELPSVIRQPVIVLPEGSVNHPDDGLRFVAEIYPQKAENSLYYRLKLVNEQGEDVRLENGQYKVYLPYPEGLTEEQKQNLVLYHMNDAHVELENFSINGDTLHCTDSGIWFQAKSFSPFVLEWSGGDDGECVHEDLRCDITDDGSRLVEFCDRCGHLSLVMLHIPGQIQSGEPVEPELIFEGDEWLSPEPQVYYALVLGEDEYTEWTTEAPSDPGDYAARLVQGMVETEDVLFSIVKPEPGEPGQMRLVVVPFGDEHITEELKAKFTEAHDIRITLCAMLLRQRIQPASTELYEVQLQRWENGSWVRADEKYFPLNSSGKPDLLVEIMAPERSDPARHEYAVIHMFDDDAFGNVPGSMETPDVEVFTKADGSVWLRFRLTGLSPVMIGWKDAPAAPPQTGDSSMPLAWLALCVSALMCAKALLRRRNA